MNDPSYDGSTEIYDYAMYPTRDLLMMYIDEQGKIANALGRPNSPTYNQEAARQLDEADQLYSSGIARDDNANERDQRQKQILIDALHTLDKAKKIINLQ